MRGWVKGTFNQRKSYEGSYFAEKSAHSKKIKGVLMKRVQKRVRK
jgi:hypothetical protein